MSTQASDQQLGQRFAQLLKARRPVELQKALNLLQDLMGVDVSLLPSIRLLASQPTFLRFLNTQPEDVPLPQRDALLVNAKEILAPAQITRIANFLDGYLGTNSPVSELTRASESQMPFKKKAAQKLAFPKVLTKASDELPTTVVEPFSRSAGTPANSSKASTEREGSKQQKPYALVLFVLVLSTGVVVLFRHPALCQPFALCSATESNKGKASSKDESEQNMEVLPDATRKPVIQGYRTSMKSRATTCWWQMIKGSKTLSPAPCYLSSGYNDDSDLVIMLVEKGNGLTREIVLNSNGFAEVTLDRRLYNGTWNIDKESDIWIDLSGGSFAFRLPINGQNSNTRENRRAN